jgi:DNA-binding transcriptional LysR family regulator
LHHPESGPYDRRVLDWNDLKWFVAVVDAGSFRLAASTTGLNHTTLSRRVRALEEALGTSLLERQPTGIKVTEAGEDLRQSCTVLIEEVAELQRRIAGKDQRPEGRVTVTYSDGFAPFVIEAVAKLGQEYPEISVVHLNTEDFVDVERGEADIAVRVSNHPPENLLGRRIGEVAWGLYGAASRYADPPDEIVPADHDWIGFSGRWAKAPPTAWLKENVPKARIRAEVDDPQSIRGLAIAGIGLGLLMRVDGDREARLTYLGAWPGALPPTSLWLLVHPDVRRARRVRVVADALYESLRAVDAAFV